MIRLLHVLGHVLVVALILAGTGWAATAVWLQLSGPVRLIALALLGLTALAALGLWFGDHRGLALALVALAAVTVGGWYQTITPRQDRDWEIDVTRGVTARIAGERVTLSDIRDFDWTSETEATPRWITREYDLTKLDRLDMITSVWSRPDIAHLLVSFGFSDDQHVVFSVEIRREKGEKFNEIGGFFRQFEQVLIAATEEDIVKLRTNYRKEQVRLYPVDLTPAQIRGMFLSYLALAQELEQEPRFYNTLTSNCTTAVWRLARSLKPDLPIDRRLVLSGRLPDYLTDLGVIAAAPAAERDAAALITPLGQRFDGTKPFSDLIRGR
ncbi:Lnb N-terminal periplasmic domain-containing protein [Rhodobacter capsulatus]|uniref:Lnb N-terminal periplasmic domain-containing protein n=1 Tax=Rhodobacter capsulatus TaxID=1061 RepID=UPI0003D37B88|nr:DUF4105 domain-containing protein [Rhodobacter capsulatus]ETD88766.1 hypothetical protein U713_11905 [Rhodobacter capsulatus YW2]